MHTVVTGTPDTRTEHSPGLAATGLMISMGVPVAVVVVGILTRGWNAISWPGAIVWGIVATFAFTLFMLMGKSMGMTRMDLLDMLGSMFARPHSATSRMSGFFIHHMNGALLAIAWVYGAALLRVPANWISALVWSAILWALAMLMMTSIGGVHPAIRRGEEEDPGTAATNLGKMTPMGSLLGHLVYGLVLGILYQIWPLS